MKEEKSIHSELIEGTIDHSKNKKDGYVRPFCITTIYEVQIFVSIDIRRFSVFETSFSIIRSTIKTMIATTKKISCGKATKAIVKLVRIIAMLKNKTPLFFWTLLVAVFDVVIVPSFVCFNYIYIIHYLPEIVVTAIIILLFFTSYMGY